MISEKAKFLTQHRSLFVSTLGDTTTMAGELKFCAVKFTVNYNLSIPTPSAAHCYNTPEQTAS